MLIFVLFKKQHRKYGMFQRLFFFASRLLNTDVHVLIKNVLVVTVYKCRLRSFWSSAGISWILLGRISSHPIHRVPWQGHVQLLHKLLQFLVGITKSTKNVQVNCTFLAVPPLFPASMLQVTEKSLNAGAPLLIPVRLDVPLCQVCGHSVAQRDLKRAKNLDVGVSNVISKVLSPLPVF